MVYRPLRVIFSYFVICYLGSINDLLTLVCSSSLRNGEDFFCYLFVFSRMFSYLCVWLIHKIYFCVLIVRLVVKQGEFFLLFICVLANVFVSLCESFHN